MSLSLNTTAKHKISLSSTGTVPPFLVTKVHHSLTLCVSIYFVLASQSPCIVVFPLLCFHKSVSVFTCIMQYTLKNCWEGNVLVHMQYLSVIYIIYCIVRNSAVHNKDRACAFLPIYAVALESTQFYVFVPSSPFGPYYKSHWCILVYVKL